jgi:hypothetical protein
MEMFWQDLCFGARTLLKKPGLTAIVVLTLALGIGANAAIFSLIYGILLRPFPYRDADRIVRVESVDTKTTGNIQGGSQLISATGNSTCAALIRSASTSPFPASSTRAAALRNR